MLKHTMGKLVIAILTVLIVASILTPPFLVSADFSYQFQPSSNYTQSDAKVTLYTFNYNGPPYPAREIWYDPSWTGVTYCPTNACGVQSDQQLDGSGNLIWKSFYFYISGQHRSSGTYTVVVYRYDRDVGIYIEMFRANFYISSGTTNTPTPTMSTHTLTPTGPTPTSTLTVTPSVTPTFTTTPGSPLRCYVNAIAGGANTGASWANAYTDLQSALGASTCTEVWVQSGTYKPTAGTDRSATFRLKNYVALYGGFVGTETARADRNPALNVTTLSGDIGVPGDNSDNSYHVITGASGATLDGFTITAGNANAHADFDLDGYGGGMYNLYSNPTLSNIIFSGNSAEWGGGIYNE